VEKFKICPSCGIKNSPISLECTSCESDLTSVRVLDKEAEKALLEKQSQNDGSVLVRICDCGVKNLPAARKCSSCGEDISDIQPETDTNHVTTYILSSIDGAYTFEVNKPTVTIGREQSMKEYLCKKVFVSRVHAKIVIDDNTLIIENLSPTNFTFVNNKKLSLGEQAELSNGDELGLGGFEKNGQRQSDAAYFVVKESCL